MTPKGDGNRYDLRRLYAAAGATREKLAERLSVPLGTVDGWARRGLPWYRADAAAVALGLHPGTVWPEWWDVNVV